ncbi:MAG: hypothetical protein FJ294_11050 [Planctomycetes bacterium]|nr:hypothetical protein [Planctomycetota bacterium]
MKTVAWKPRSIPLPEGRNAEPKAMVAKLEQGVLEVRIPKLEPKLTTRLKIEGRRRVRRVRLRAIASRWACTPLRRVSASSLTPAVRVWILWGSVQSDALLVFAGRTHLALLHFPVAFLPLAAALALLDARAPDELRARIVRLLARVGAASAVLAALTGWIHADAEPLGRTLADALNMHRWLGMACCLLSLVGVFARTRVRLGALVGSALLALGAGHMGGELVHGEGYLSEPFRAPRASVLVEPVAADKSLAFADVQPIFEARCVECHGPVKHKGELRLDAFDARWFEPGEFGTPVVARRAAESEIVRRMRLPLDDEDHMPPAKKPQHSPDELAALERWIDSGARP